MALPRYDHDVALMRFAEGLADGRFAVHFHKVRLAGFLQAHQRVAHDAERVFAAWIVGGQNGQVGQRARGFAHQGSLRAVAITSAAKDNDQAAARQFPSRRENILQGVIGMGVVHEDQEGLSGIHPLESPRDAGERRHPFLDGFAGYPQAPSRRRRGHDVHEIWAAKKR